MSTCQLEFRSCERRRRYLPGQTYKHSTPNGVKPVLPLTSSIKTPLLFDGRSSLDFPQRLRKSAQIITTTLVQLRERARLWDGIEVANFNDKAGGKIRLLSSVIRRCEHDSKQFLTTNYVGLICCDGLRFPELGSEQQHNGSNVSGGCA